MSNLPMTPQASKTFCEQHGHNFDMLNSNLDGRLVKYCTRCEVSYMLVLLPSGQTQWRRTASVDAQGDGMELCARHDENE